MENWNPLSAFSILKCPVYTTDIFWWFANVHERTLLRHVCLWNPIMAYSMDKILTQKFIKQIITWIIDNIVQKSYQSHVSLTAPRSPACKLFVWNISKSN